MDAWVLELLIVRERMQGGEQRSLARDCARGLIVRIRPGVYVERVAFEALPPEGRHVVAMRALAAVASEAPVFSHWSAAVLHGLPFLGEHLDRVHVVVEDAALRGLVGVAGHVAPAGHGLTLIGGLVSPTSRGPSSTWRWPRRSKRGW